MMLWNLHQQQHVKRCDLDGVSPGASAFGRDVLMNIPIVADIIAVSEN